MKIATGRTIDIIGFLGLLFMWVWLAIGYWNLPDQVPIHYDFRGRPDNYGDKLTILILPLIASILYLVLYKPAKYSVAGKLQAVGVVVALAALLVKSIQVAKGNAETIGLYFLPLVMALVLLPGIAYAFTAKRK